MKSYGHLWEEYLSDSNYYAAIQNATRHKGGKKGKAKRARYIREHADEMKAEILEYAANFHPDPHTPKIINDGIQRKKRTIWVPSMREEIVHHMMINVLRPIFLRPMYEHSYGSIPGRGAMRGRKKKTKSGKKAIEKYIREHPKECRYCLKMDIRKYFDSVSHEKLTEMLRRKIRDGRFMQVLDRLVNGAEGETGIPIGFYTSQWFANFYLTGFDHWMKERMHVKGYFRYVDDLVVFGSNKRELHRLRLAVDRYLREELGLELNRKWQVFRFHYAGRAREYGRFLDFMGFRFYRNRTTLRRSLLYRAARKARRIARERPKTAHSARQMTSYAGWLRAADVYMAYRKWIKPYVSFRQMRRITAATQRKRNEEAGACGIQTATATA